MLEKFNNYFKPSLKNTIASEKLVNKYKSKVPESLIHLWKSTGLGKYNDGVIEFINPKDFEPVLWTWLGREVENYTAFAITGFGELFYYRKLTETDEDVCMIDIQFRNIETIVWDFEVFLEETLTDVEEREELLRESLFKKAIAELGSINNSEIFTFAPILAMGGDLDTKF